MGSANFYKIKKIGKTTKNKIVTSGCVSFYGFYVTEKTDFGNQTGKFST